MFITVSLSEDISYTVYTLPLFYLLMPMYSIYMTYFSKKKCNLCTLLCLMNSNDNL